MLSSAGDVAGKNRSLMEAKKALIWGAGGRDAVADILLLLLRRLIVTGLLMVQAAAQELVADLGSAAGSLVSCRKLL